MRRRAVWAVLGAVVAVVLAVVVVGVTDTFGTGRDYTGQIGGWMPDGADKGTFWDSNVVDIPGVSLTAMHCHGSVEYVLQLGATGPGRSNPCYAAMGEYTGGSSELDLFMLLPGDRAVYRTSHDYGPWRYCVADVISGPEVNYPC